MEDRMDGSARAEERAAQALARAARIAARLEALTASVAQHIRAWYDRARQRRALEAVDDWVLRDIGISRTDAMQEHDKPFWRP
jgi:uncharacterized protein YjiS (DUF1127 family)